MAAPLYNVGDVVYLAESAKLGSLESYRISGVRQDADGLWQYKISVSAKPSASSMTYGDRINLRNPFDFELPEDNLINYCDAIDFALLASESRVNKLRSLKSIQCPDDTGTGTE